MAALHRFRQGIRALAAPYRQVDVELAARYLSESELALFCRLQRSEQQHSLNVLRTVLAQSSTTPPELAAAALLHDVGKIRYPLRVWQKSLVVLVRALIPPLYRRMIASDERNFWARPFFMGEYHPQWSAELLREAGSAEATIWLAAHHGDPRKQWLGHEYHPLLERLQQADGEN